MEKYIVYNCGEDNEYVETMKEAIEIANKWDEDMEEYFDGYKEGYIGIYKLVKELKVYDDPEAYKEYLNDLEEGEKPEYEGWVRTEWVDRLTLEEVSNEDLIKEIKRRKMMM